MAGRPLAGHKFRLGTQNYLQTSEQGTHWRSSSTVSDCETMHLVQRAGLLPGGRPMPQGQVPGLVTHTARRPACVRMRAASPEDSNTDNSAQPDIPAGSKSMVPSTQYRGQLLDVAAITARVEAQAEELKLNKRFEKDLKYLPPSLAVAYLVSEIMRAVNWQIHIWGDTTPVYCGAFQAVVMLGWLYVAVQGAAMPSVPPTDTASLTQMIQQQPDEGPDDSSDLSEALTALLPNMKQVQDYIDKQLHVTRAYRSSYVAQGVQLAALLCSELVQEYTSTALGVLYALYATQSVAFLAWLYFFIDYRRNKDQPYAGSA